MPVSSALLLLELCHKIKILLKGQCLRNECDCFPSTDQNKLKNVAYGFIPQNKKKSTIIRSCDYGILKMILCMILRENM